MGCDVFIYIFAYYMIISIEVDYKVCNIYFHNCWFQKWGWSRHLEKLHCFKICGTLNYMNGQAKTSQWTKTPPITYIAWGWIIYCNMIFLNTYIVHTTHNKFWNEVGSSSNPPSSLRSTSYVSPNYQWCKIL